MLECPAVASHTQQAMKGLDFRVDGIVMAGDGLAETHGRLAGRRGQVYP